MKRMNAEQRIASRYIPQDSTKLDAPEADLIVYLYEIDGRPCAIGYGGTRGYHWKYVFFFFYHHFKQECSFIIQHLFQSFIQIFSLVHFSGLYATSFSEFDKIRALQRSG